MPAARIPRILAALAVAAALAHPALARQDARYEAGFERDVNRYRWSAGLELEQRVGSWQLALVERYRSDAFLLFDDRLSFRDENALELRALAPSTGAVRAVVRGRSNWYSLSRVLSQSLTGGLVWTPVPGLSVEPAAGIAMDRRPGALTSGGVVPVRSDAGPSVGLRLAVPRSEVGGYSVRVDGDASWQRIQPRRAGAVRLEADAGRTFEKTTVRAEMLVATVRRDAYQAASFLNRDEALSRAAESIESTRSDTATAALSVDAAVTDRFTLGSRVVLSANNRAIRTRRAPEDALYFDTDFSRQAAEAGVTARYASGGTELRATLEGGAETERRTLANEEDLPGSQAAQKRDLLRQADYDRGFVTLRLDLRVPLGGTVVLAADGSANGIRHDTPVINLDDRDELFYNGRVGLLFRAAPQLDLDLQVFGSYYHTVYLKAARSAENNVQRSLRLRPGARWRPTRSTRIELTSEVRATYTVDDFVLPGRRPSDQAAREMRYDLSVEQDLGAGLRVLADGRYSDLRLGRFLKDAFAEIPYDTLRTYGSWVRLQTGGRTTAEIGVRLFVRTDFDRSATVRYPRTGEDGTVLTGEDGAPLTGTISRPGRRRIAQIGPTCAVVFPLRNGAFLRFDGWLTVQRVTARLYGDLPEPSAAAIRRAAARGTRTLIPNLAVSMQWLF